MSNTMHRLEALKNRFFHRDHNDTNADNAEKAWQIVVFDLAGSTYRLLKELESRTFDVPIFPAGENPPREQALLPAPGFLIFDLHDHDLPSPA